MYQKGIQKIPPKSRQNPLNSTDSTSYYSYSRGEGLEIGGNCLGVYYTYIPHTPQALPSPLDPPTRHRATSTNSLAQELQWVDTRLVCYSCVLRLCVVIGYKDCIRLLYGGMVHLYCILLMYGMIALPNNYQLAQFLLVPNNA